MKDITKALGIMTGTFVGIGLLAGVVGTIVDAEREMQRKNAPAKLLPNPFAGPQGNRKPLPGSDAEKAREENLKRKPGEPHGSE